MAANRSPNIPLLFRSGNDNVKAVSVYEKVGDRTRRGVFAKRPNDWTVKLVSTYNSQYPGGSDDAIIDGLRGNTNFAAGEWQGFQGKTFEAVIDLQRETEIKNVGGSFLQSARSWIWMPVSFNFEISKNGTEWAEIADIKTDVPQTEMNPIVKEFRKSITPVKARYVRVRASFGKDTTMASRCRGDPWYSSMRSLSTDPQNARLSIVPPNNWGEFKLCGQGCPRSGNTMDRRYFLKTSGIALGSFGMMAAAPDFLHQFASTKTKSGYGKKNVLVTIFQRGAVDGLNMVVRFGDEAYYSLRR